MITQRAFRGISDGDIEEIACGGAGTLVDCLLDIVVVVVVVTRRRRFSSSIDNRMKVYLLVEFVPVSLVLESMVE